MSTPFVCRSPRCRCGRRLRRAARHGADRGDAHDKGQRTAKAKPAHKPGAPPVVVPVPDASPEQVKAAELVYYGQLRLRVPADGADHPEPQVLGAMSTSSHGKGDWLMKPVLSSTGAIRLEDVRGETLMVQIASKSMLLNVKTAHRIVDDCISPKQRELIAEAKAAKAAADDGGIRRSPRSRQRAP